ncbi:MAG: hypothetical protein ABIU87_01460 [Ornithinibacter sp.]
MPIVAISGAPSREEYDAVSGNIDLDHRPTGWLVHAAALLPDDSVQIVDIFDSQESMEAVGAQLVLPSFDQAGVDVRDRRPPAAQETFAYHGPALTRP